MRLTDIPALLIEDAIRKWRRRLLAGLIVLAFGLGALIEGVAALRIALEMAAGPLAARLILTGLFLAVVLAAALLVLRAERRPAKPRLADADERIVVIAEAINLGYALARDLAQSKTSAAADTPSTNGAAAPAAAAEEAPARPAAASAPA